MEEKRVIDQCIILYLQATPPGQGEGQPQVLSQVLIPPNLSDISWFLL